MKKKGLKQYVFVSYSLASLSQKNKVKAIRELYGYDETKGSKRYEHDGLIDTLHIEKFGRNVLIVSLDKLPELHNFLSSHSISYKIKEAWLR